ILIDKGQVAFHTIAGNRRLLALTIVTNVIVDRDGFKMVEGFESLEHLVMALLMPPALHMINREYFVMGRIFPAGQYPVFSALVIGANRDRIMTEQVHYRRAEQLEAFVGNVEVLFQRPRKVEYQLDAAGIRDFISSPGALTDTLKADQIEELELLRQCIVFLNKPEPTQQMRRVW